MTEEYTEIIIKFLQTSEDEEWIKSKSNESIFVLIKVEQTLWDIKFYEIIIIIELISLYFIRDLHVVNKTSLSKFYFSIRSLHFVDSTVSIIPDRNLRGQNPKKTVRIFPGTWTHIGTFRLSLSTSAVAVPEQSL